MQVVGSERMYLQRFFGARDWWCYEALLRRTLVLIDLYSAFSRVMVIMLSSGIATNK